MDIVMKVVINLVVVVGDYGVHFDLVPLLHLTQVHFPVNFGIL